MRYGVISQRPSCGSYYLRDRFTIASGNETQRLYYLTSHLSTQGGPIENWKLMIGGQERKLHGNR
jgi:hypothetical protein